jgi:hypothetical protein
LSGKEKWKKFSIVNQWLTVKKSLICRTKTDKSGVSSYGANVQVGQTVCRNYHKHIEAPYERAVYLHKQKYSLVFQQTLKKYLEHHKKSHNFGVVAWGKAIIRGFIAF